MGEAKYFLAELPAILVEIVAVFTSFAHGIRDGMFGILDALSLVRDVTPFAITSVGLDVFAIRYQLKDKARKLADSKIKKELKKLKAKLLTEITTTSGLLRTKENTKRESGKSMKNIMENSTRRVS